MRMDPNYYGIVEMLFSFGIVLGFAVWQLISVRRSRKNDDK